MNPAILIGLALLAYVALKGQAATKLRFTMSGFKISKGKLSLNIQIFNPTNQTLTLDSFIGDIYYNGSAIANVNRLGRVPIPANQIVNVPFNVSLNSISTATALYTALVSKTENKDKGIKMVATINAEGVNFDQTFTL